VVSPPRVPLVALGVVAVAAVVVVNAAALGAGVVGWRRSPAVALRAE
jgi:hypothetical protein